MATLINRDQVLTMKFHSDRAQDDSEGMSVASLFTNDLSDVIRMDLNGEARAFFCGVRLDDYKFGPVNQRADDLGEQL